MGSSPNKGNYEARVQILPQEGDYDERYGPGQVSTKQRYSQKGKRGHGSKAKIGPQQSALDLSIHHEQSVLDTPRNKTKKPISNKDVVSCSRGRSQQPSTISLRPFSRKRAKKSDYSNIMRKRWLNSLEQKIPKIDFNLIKDGKEDEMFASEFSQEVYERQLLQESQQQTKNVFKSGMEVEEDTITTGDRERAVRTLINLVERNYFNDATLHQAISIMDRGIALNYQDLDHYGLQRLMAASLFLGAKLEQPMNPSGKIVISKLVKEDIEYITIEDILETEHQLVQQLDFNFQHVNSIDFLDRFLQLTNLDEDEEVIEYAEKVMLTFKVKNPSIEFRPSVLAAASLYYSVLQNNDYDKATKKEFLRKWEKLQSLTRVSIVELKDVHAQLLKILKKKSQQRKDRELQERSQHSNLS